MDVLELRPENKARRVVLVSFAGLSMVVGLDQLDGCWWQQFGVTVCS